MKNKYAIGVDDNGNTNYDFVRVCKDMKDVVLGKKKFTKSLYEVMIMRFTIAHYDMEGWWNHYLNNWTALSNELFTYTYNLRPEDEQAILDLKEFLNNPYQSFFDKLEKHGFSVKKYDSYYNAQQHTPAGEDWNIEFTDKADFIRQAKNFDVDEAFGLWFNSGAKGVPKAAVLLKDQEWKKRLLNKIIKNEK